MKKVLSLPSPQHGLVIWMVLPLCRVLPWLAWCFLLAVSLAAWILPRKFAIKSQVMIAITLIGGVGLLLLTSQPWLSGENLLAVLALIAVAKQFEVNGYRDRQVLVFAVFISSAFNLIYWNNLLSLAHLLVLMWLIVLTYQSAISDGASTAPHKQIKHRAAAELMLWSTPLALICFLLLPRIPGPLWNLGLVFGMPLHVFEKVENVSLSSGDIASSSVRNKQNLANKVVLVAEFKGGVPSKSRLYWRGAAYSQLRQEQWLPDSQGLSRSARLRTAWRDKTAYEKALRYESSPVEYKVKVAANNDYWLYGLDLIEQNVQESYVTQNLQLFSIRPIRQEFQYQATSYLDFSFAGAPPTEPVISAIPRAVSSELAPFIRSLNAELKQHADSKKLYKAIELIALNEQQLTGGGFMYGAPTGVEVKDLLLHKLGYYMVALQHAGIPTRMLSGFRGGDLVALTDFIVVRRKHAHVWLEVWQPESGWQKLELMDIWNQKTAAKQIKRSEKKQTSAKTADPEAKPTAQKQTFAPPKPEKKQGWLASLEAWFIGYSPVVDKSEGEMALGNEEGGKQPLPLWGGAFAICVWACGFILFWRRRHREDPVELQWLAFVDKLASHNIVIASWQCHSELITQLNQKAPAWQDAALQIIQQWEQIRYQQRSDLRATFPAMVTRFNAALD